MKTFSFRWAWLALSVAFLFRGWGAPDLTSRLEYLGTPADDRWGSAGRGFEHAALDLEVFHDRVFVGMGNWDSNFGPCYIPAFDTTTGAYRNEYVAGTEAVETIRTFDDDTLCVPATDHCEGGAYGYVNRDWFIRTADGAWSGASASPNSGLGQIMVHNWDMAKFGDWVFCGGYGVAGSKAGGIWSSVADDPGNSLRVTSFIRCGDELFCRSAASSIYFTSGRPDDAKAGYQPKLWHWNKTSERFEQVASSWADMMPGVRQSDFALTYANPAAYANHHAGTWHATPFRNRNLYIVGTVGYSVNFGKDLGGQIAPRGVFPAFAVSGYAENGVLKGDRVELPSGTYPYDFAVSGNAAYMLTFRYKSDTQTVEHGVWKTTDGVGFTELFTFDYHEVMMSVEYHKGWFYFGVSHKKSQPLLGTLASGTEETAGAVYRVRCPQEPVQVVASAPSLAVAEGASRSVAFSLSAAPASNLTLRVVCASDNPRFSATPATLTFTTSDWATPKSVTVSLADDAVVNREVTGRLVCGTAGADAKRGLLAGDEVTAATVVLTPEDGENVAPANGEIRTADDFYCAMCRPDGDYRLMNDLDLSAADFETIPLWSGSFDGQGHTITGLAVPVCRVSSGSFSNLTLDGGGATNHVIRSGVFCETVRGGAFTNCTVRGWSVRTAAGSRNEVGLFAAVAEAVSVFSGCTTAADCAVGQEAQQVDINLGGFVGKVTATNATVYGTVAVFDGCTNNAAVSGVGCNNTSYGRGGFVGAIVGFSSAATPYPEVDFVRSANFGSVTSTGKMENLGGFVGKIDGASNNKTCVLARFDGCLNSGVVTSSGAGNSCGGLVGLVNACANATFDGCTNNAAIGSATVTESGGLVGGFANASKLDVGGLRADDCANLADVAAKTYAGGLVGTASSNGGWGTGRFQFFDSMNTGAVCAVSTTNAEIVANCSFSSTSATTTLVISNCVTVTENLCVACSKTPVAEGNRLLSELPPEEPVEPPEEPVEPPEEPVEPPEEPVEPPEDPPAAGSELTLLARTLNIKGAGQDLTLSGYASYLAALQAEFATLKPDVAFLTGQKGLSRFSIPGYEISYTTTNGAMVALGSVTGQSLVFAWNPERMTLEKDYETTLLNGNTGYAAHRIVLKDASGAKILFATLQSANFNLANSGHQTWVSGLYGEVTNDYPDLSAAYTVYSTKTGNVNADKEALLAAHLTNAVGFVEMSRADNHVLFARPAVQTRESSVSDAGVSSAGDGSAVVGALYRIGAGGAVELAAPEFAADGSALGFETAAGGAREFTLRIANPVKGAYYTVLVAETLEGPFLPAAESTLFEGGETLTLRIAADAPQKFAKVMVSKEPKGK